MRLSADRAEEPGALRAPRYWRGSPSTIRQGLAVIPQGLGPPLGVGLQQFGAQQPIGPWFGQHGLEAGHERVVLGGFDGGAYLGQDGLYEDPAMDEMLLS